MSDWPLEVVLVERENYSLRARLVLHKEREARLVKAMRALAKSRSRDFPGDGPQSCAYCYVIEPDDHADHNEDCPTRIAGIALTDYERVKEGDDLG